MTRAISTNPTASKIKFHRNVLLLAPKTLHIFTVRMRTGTSAMKKFTKFMKATITITRAIASCVIVVPTEPFK